jgi:hypothetical protein
MDQLNAYVLAAGLTKSALNLNGLATRQRDNVMRVLTGLVERRQVGQRAWFWPCLGIADTAAYLLSGRPSAGGNPYDGTSESHL